MKILIIGGTGRISYKTSEYLIRQKHDVTILNRGNHRNLGLDSYSVTADINRPEEVKLALKDRVFDAVVDFLSFTPKDIVLHLSYFKNSPHYIFVSSTVATNRKCVHMPFDENTPLGNPDSEYGNNKALSERFLSSCGYQNYTILRPSHTFDEREFPTLIHGKGTFTIVHRILEGKPIPVIGNGEGLWSILYAEDFGKALNVLLGNEQCFGEVFNVTALESHTWKEIFELEGSILGQMPILFSLPLERFVQDYPAFHDGLVGDKAISSSFDNRKICKIAPIFKTQCSLIDALIRTKEYVFQHEEMQKIDAQFDSFLDEICKKYR